eukprot:1136350-Pelagomonas_calceolata.AAC.4
MKGLPQELNITRTALSREWAVLAVSRQAAAVLAPLAPPSSTLSGHTKRESKPQLGAPSRFEPLDTLELQVANVQRTREARRCKVPATRVNELQPGCECMRTNELHPGCDCMYPDALHPGCDCTHIIVLHPGSGCMHIDVLHPGPNEPPEKTIICFRCEEAQGCSLACLQQRTGLGWSPLENPGSGGCSSKLQSGNLVKGFRLTNPA